MESGGRLFPRILVSGRVLPGNAAAGRDVASIARAIEAHYQATTTLKATFLQRRSEGKRAIEIESGTVYFRRPRRMRWEYESPETKLFLADGKFVWFYVPADHTVSRAKMKESDDARVPLVLLAGQARLGRVCRRVELADIHVLTAGNVALRCLPKANQSDFRAAILEVDSGYRLVRILVSEAGDVETEFRFANWQENLPVSQNLFRFQPPAGVSIVDDSSARSPAP